MMNRQIRFEIRQLLLSKIVCVLIVILLALNIGLAWTEAEAYQPETTRNDSTAIQKLVRRAERQLEQLLIQTEDGDGYAIRYYRKLIDRYRPLQELELPGPDSQVSGWDQVISFSSGNALLLLSVALVSVTMFSREKQYGSLPIVYTTVNGRARFIVSKLIAVAICSACLNLLFFLTALLGTSLQCRLSGLGQYIQSFAAFQMSPFSVRTWTVLVISLLLKTCITIAVAALCGLFAYLVGGRLLPMFGFILLYAANRYANGYPYLNADVFLSQCNLIAGMDTARLFEQFRCTRVFGRPESTLAVLSLVSLTLIAVVSVSILLAHRYHIGWSRKKHRALSRTGHKTVPVHGLWRWEWKKFAQRRIVLLLLFMMLVLMMLEIWIPAFRPVSNADRIYQYYIETIAPMSQPDRESYIEDESRRIRQAFSEYESYLTKVFEKGEYVENAAEIEREYEYACTHSDPFLKLQQYLAYLQSHPDFDRLTLLYDTGWLRLFQSGNSLILFLVIILVGNLSVHFEHVTGFAPILRSTVNGPRSFRAKSGMCLAITVALFLLASICQICGILVRYRLPEAGAPLASISAYPHAPLQISLLMYVVMIYLVRFFSCIAICLFTLKLSSRISGSIAVLTIELLIGFVPEIIRVSTHGAVFGLHFASFYDGNQSMVYAMNGGEGAFWGWLAAGVILYFLADIILFCKKKKWKGRRCHEA